MATAPFNCFAIAAPGLESIVARELSALGEQPRIEDGGVSWDGDARSLMRANLWLRTASRVLARVARFKTTAFYELEKRAKRIPWAQFVTAGQAVEFRVTARKSKLYHSDAIAERLVKSVRSVVGAKHGPTANPKPHIADRSTGQQLFVVRVFHDEFTISADTSGELLHMRGYRQAVGKAPMRETLAAALLLGADWDGSTPLLDPFCGSGTIPIEGTLIARRIPPGLNRRFAFMDWPTFNVKSWRTLLHQAQTGARASSPVPIFGSDRDAGAIAASRANAERAGVAADIDFQVRPISAIERSSTPGLIATNPPYGVRVSERATLRDLYARLGQVIRDRPPGWRAVLYSSDARLARELGMPSRELFRTTNGGIKVAALEVEVPRGDLVPA